jgi:uncharacterized protein with FMN-binding domain
MRKAITIILVVAILGVLGTMAVSNSRNPSSARNSSSSVSYQDGAYVGRSAETPYGSVQVSIVISNREINDIKFLKMPNGDDRSREITGFAGPQLKQNTLRAQDAQIDFVSGATSTTYGYQESLQSALDKAAGAVFTPLTTNIS